MKELQLLLRQFLAREITLDDLRDGFRQLLEADPELAAVAAAWLDAGERDGLLSSAVCNALKSVIVSHMAATNHGPNPASSGIFGILDMDEDGAPPAEAEPSPRTANADEGEKGSATYVRDPDATTLGDNAEVMPEPLADGRVEIGALIGGRYELLSQLGSGGMGRVFKARDRLRAEAQDRNPNIALKVLSEEFKLHPDSMIALQREVRRAQQLAHPNVITVHEFFRDGPHLYMTMELLEGRALNELCNSEYANGIPYEEAWPIIDSVCRALQYGHEKGIVHSDIKPANVFLCDDGTVKVLDLGISRPMSPGNVPNSEETAFDPGKRLGSLTPAYAALEMWYQATPDPRDDIYALSCMTYVLLTGRHPFGGASARDAKDQGLVPERIESLSRGQWNALLNGLAFERELRTASVEKFRREFEPQAVMRRNRRYAVAATLAVVLVASLVGIRYYTQAVENRTIEDSAGGQVAAAERPDLTPEQVTRFDSMLQLAEMQFTEVTPDLTSEELAYLMSLGPNSVVSIAGSILDVDPGYEGALSARRRAFDLMIDKAEDLEEDGAYDAAYQLTQLAVEFMPLNSRVLNLQRDICNKAPDSCVGQ
ncbi:MAG: serine/threonine protein kinase [Gammaproteobacteria bacterium]|nr:serine/threonine protein kinase [Gammaproteobacteria bacterium]